MYYMQMSDWGRLRTIFFMSMDMERWWGIVNFTFDSLLTTVIVSGCHRARALAIGCLRARTLAF